MPSLIAVPRMSQRHNLRNGEGWISGWEFRYFPAVPEVSFQKRAFLPAAIGLYCCWYYRECQ